MDDYTLVVGAVVSVFLLGLLIYLQKTSPNILKVPAQWVAVAALPIIVVLFAGGYITKFSGFGIILESTLKSPIFDNTDKSPVQIISNIAGGLKRTDDALKTLSRKEKLATRYLRFVSGQSVYRYDIVATYLKALPNLYFFEVVDSNNYFVYLLPIEALVTDDSDSAYDEEKIKKFVDSIALNKVPSGFTPKAITTTLAPDTDLIMVLKKMRDDGIRYIGIVRPNGEYLGVALQTEIEHQIAKSVLAESKR